jgi:hypothetical protein
MAKPMLLLTAAVLAVLAAVPSLAQANGYHRHHHRHYGYIVNFGLPYPISYLHNYGPGLEPGTFAYYDGPATVHCAQSAATYLGQDHRRHPCY